MTLDEYDSLKAGDLVYFSGSLYQVGSLPDKATDQPYHDYLTVSKVKDKDNHLPMVRDSLVLRAFHLLEGKP